MTDIGHGRGWLNADAAASLARVDARLGRPLDVNSAGRTRAQQEDLWHRYFNLGDRSFGRPAKPGTSRHESGLAIDTDDRIPWIGEHGWIADVKGEPWHFEYRAHLDRHRSGANADEATRQRQAWLNARRGEKLAVDGVQGPATTAAIKRYQAFLRVAADGKWGPKTQAAHEAYYARVTAPAPAPARSVRRGDTGDLVRAVQARLKRDYALYAGRLAVDGQFGPATDAAVREFQRRAGLTVDGIAGPQTLARLGL